jgi:hypothetical protein
MTVIALHQPLKVYSLILFIIVVITAQSSKANPFRNKLALMRNLMEQLYDIHAHIKII